MTGDDLLGRVELERAFTVLGDQLVRRGVVADLFVVGGAAMATTIAETFGAAQPGRATAWRVRRPAMETA